MLHLAYVYIYVHMYSTLPLLNHIYIISSILNIQKRFSTNYKPSIWVPQFIVFYYYLIKPQLHRAPGFGRTSLHTHLGLPWRYEYTNATKKNIPWFKLQRCSKINEISSTSLKPTKINSNMPKTTSNIPWFEASKPVLCSPE